MTPVRTSNNDVSIEGKTAMGTDPYRIFPRSTNKERVTLRSSIEAVGVKDPVVVDEFGNVIDGHERRDICKGLDIDWLAGAEIRPGLTDIQKKALAIELNLWRRPIHLTRKQRNELLDVYLVANPHLSEPQIADLFGVNQSTVNRRKRALMQSHKLPKVTATLGKDGVTRKIGERSKKPARIIVKGRAEYESLKPDLAEVANDLQGIIRRPNRVHRMAERKRANADINSAVSKPLPAEFSFQCCDFRDLKVEPNSLDLILTDVVWSLVAGRDWEDLAMLAKGWLRDKGIFCSLIGNNSWPYFCRAVLPHLSYQFSIILDLATPSRSWSQQLIESWRPIAVFAKTDKRLTFDHMKDRIKASTHIEKDYDDWQQSLPVAIELLDLLSKPGDTICDPQMGTGTNAVACALIGAGRTFIGCDIDPQKVRITRHRVNKEGSA